MNPQGEHPSGTKAVQAASPGGVVWGLLLSLHPSERLWILSVFLVRYA